MCRRRRFQLRVVLFLCVSSVMLALSRSRCPPPAVLNIMATNQNGTSLSDRPTTNGPSDRSVTEFSAASTDGRRDTRACQPIHVDPKGEFPKLFYKPHPKIDCAIHRENISATNGTIYIDRGQDCSAYAIIHTPGDRIRTPPIGKIRNGQRMPDHFIAVRCNQRVTGLASAYRNDELLRRKKLLLKTSNMNLNVIMVAFDSTSRTGAETMLSHSLKYFKEQMGGIVMQGMNIVGDGTPQALIPMFTGKTELELPSTRREDRDNASFVDDVYPLIFKNYSDNGYITTFFERFVDMATFQMRLKGFRSPLADFYGYPFFLKTEGKDNKKTCFGNKTELQFNLDFHRELMENYPDVPKFMFSFQQSCHDSSNVLSADDSDLLSYLKLWNTLPHRQNSVFILLSDHGPRFGKVRKHYEGRLEERNSLFAISLPSWVESTYPYASRNLVRNSKNYLITPFDIHSTLLHLLYGLPHEPENETKRSISMFHEIPDDRSCASAGIAQHWCTCLVEKLIDPQSLEAAAAATVVVDHINNMVASVGKCKLQTLDKVLSCTETAPTKELLTFSGNTDDDGFEYGFYDNVSHTKTVQIRFVTLPASYMYEATVTIKAKGTASVANGQLSMLSRYGANANCVVKTHPNLRQFCICTS